MTDLTKQGRLIVFEGTDGTGKSTQLKLFASYLRKKGYPVITTREPTDGQYGQEIRLIYANRDKYSREEELNLFLADRKEHVEKLLLPALQGGKIVLCDRYFLSTAAYQGARGFDPEHILFLNRFAPDPDLALLFQAPVKTGLKRITSDRGDILNDFEQEESLKKVAAIFSTIKRSYIQPVDVSGSIMEVHHKVVEIVSPILPVFSTDQV